MAPGKAVSHPLAQSGVCVRVCVCVEGAELAEQGPEPAPFQRYQGEHDDADAHGVRQ